MMKKVIFILAMLTCIWASCSEEPIIPEIIIETNHLSFDAAKGERSVSFSSNTNWTLSVTSTIGGTTWCKASVTAGSKGSTTVTFTVNENTEYDDRSALVTINSGSISETFTITQKGADALLVSTNKFEIAQEGGKIEIEVKANIDYQFSISENSKDWITESRSRSLTVSKHIFEIAPNGELEKREGEIFFKSGDKEVTVKVYQEGVNIVEIILDEAGSLKTLLGEDYFNIKALKLVGPINGDDIYFLRKMLGAQEFKEIDRGNLTTLDLSETTIVEGGSWYYKYDTFNEYYYTSNNIIGESMFSVCVNLQKIILPECITSIDDNAFSFCENLTSIELVDNITYIDIMAFIGCKRLNSVTIGTGITSIRYSAFSATINIDYVYIKDLSAWCNIDFEEQTSNPLWYGSKFYLNNKEIIELVIPKDITQIKQYAFYGCESFEKVIIHENITEIGIQAFYDTHITTLYCYATTPPVIINNDAFNSIDSKAVLYVPKGCSKEYESKWGRFFNNIVEME